MPPIPQTTDILNGVATTSSPMFSALLPWALLGTGFIVGGLIVYAIMHWIIGGISNVIHGKEEKYD